MEKNIYQLLKNVLREHPKRFSIRLKSLNNTILVERDKHDSDGIVLVLFSVTAKEPLTKEKVKAAIGLFPEANFKEAGFAYIKGRREIVENLPLIAVPDVYMKNKDNLMGVLERHPRTDINNNLLDDPSTVPEHKGRRVFCGFEEFDPKNPQFGYVWNDFVLYKDGISMRLAKQANFMYSLSPELAQSPELAAAMDSPCDIKAEQELQRKVLDIIAKGNIRSIDDIMKRIEKTPQPVILPTELEYVKSFMSNIAGVDLASIEYSPEI